MLKIFRRKSNAPREPFFSRFQFTEGRAFTFQYQDQKGQFRVRGFERQGEVIVLSGLFIIDSGAMMFSTYLPVKIAAFKARINAMQCVEEMR